MFTRVLCKETTSFLHGKLHALEQMLQEHVFPCAVEQFLSICIPVHISVFMLNLQSVTMHWRNRATFFVL